MPLPSPALLVKLGRLATPSQRVISNTKARDLFHEVARCIPWVLTNYKLEEITTAKELRSNVAKLFKIHEGLRNEGAIDVMIFKGREELEVKSPSRVLAQQVEAGWKKHDLANQIADYLTRVETMRKAEALGSPFLSAFYAGNQSAPVSASTLGQSTRGI